MKTSIKSVVIGTASALILVLVITSISENRAHAQSVMPAPTPEPATVSAEQYKVVEMRSTGQLFEGTLNQLAKDGWKVRTSINGSYLILAK